MTARWFALVVSVAVVAFVVLRVDPAWSQPNASARSQA